MSHAPRPGILTFTLLVSLLGAACAGTPGPGDPGYPFNVTGTYTGQITVEGQALGGVLTLETRAGGEVVGEVRISEMGLTAPATGSVVGDRLSLVIRYRNPGNGCDGVAESDVTVGDGGAELSGPLRVVECGQRLAGTLRFRRS